MAAPGSSADDPDHIIRAGNPQDKRDIDRVEILGELRGEVMVFQHLTIKEISRGGAQVETAFALYVDSLHDFRLTLGETSVILKGRVAHCSITDVEQEIVTYRSGVEFVDPPEHVNAVIADFIATVKQGRQSP
jgi:hypothetical protein